MSREDKQAIAADRKYRLVEIKPCTDKEIPEGCNPLTRSLIVARKGKEILLVLNRRRHEWELPGGVIEADEEPRECAIREFNGETGQDPWYLELRAVFRLESRRAVRYEWGALFECKLGDLKLFVPDQEIARLEVWNTARKMEGLNPIDRELALFVSRD